MTEQDEYREAVTQLKDLLNRIDQRLLLIDSNENIMSQRLDSLLNSYFGTIYGKFVSALNKYREDLYQIIASFTSETKSLKLTIENSFTNWIDIVSEAKETLKNTLVADATNSQLAYSVSESVVKIQSVVNRLDSLTELISHEELLFNSLKENIDTLRSLESKVVQLSQAKGAGAGYQFVQAIDQAANAAANVATLTSVIKQGDQKSAVSLDSSMTTGRGLLDNAKRPGALTLYSKGI